MNGRWSPNKSIRRKKAVAKRMGIKIAVDHRIVAELSKLAILYEFPAQMPDVLVLYVRTWLSLPLLISPICAQIGGIPHTVALK